MATGVGIDIGHSGVKVAVVDGSGKKLRVRQFVSGEFDGESARSVTDAELQEMVVGLFRKHRIPTDNVVTCIQAQQAIIRDLTSTFTRADQIAKTLRVLVEAELHAISIDRVSIDFHKYAERDGKSKLLVGVARNETIEEHLTFFDRCGLDPVAIDLDVAALFNTFTLTPHFQAEQNTLLIDIGAGSVKIILLEKGNLRMVRSMRTRMPSAARVSQAGKGTKDEFHYEELDGSFSNEPKQRKPDESVAEKAAQPTGRTGRLPLVILDDDESEVLDLMDSQITEDARSDMINKILIEVDRTIASLQLADPVQQIILTGGGSALEGITSVFEKHFEIPTTTFDLDKAIPHRLTGDGARTLGVTGGTAVGLALKAAGYDAAGMNFRQGAFEYAGVFERVKKSVACTVCLLFILLFLVAYRLMIEEHRWANMASRVRKTSQQVHYVLFPDQNAPRERVDLELKRKQTQMNQELGDVSGMPQSVSVLEMFREFADAVRKANRPIEMKSIVLSQRNCNVDILADDAETGNHIYNQIQGSPYVVMEPPKVEKDRKTEKYLVKFTFKPKVEEEGKPR